jgi:hypothetical protein
MDKSRQVIVDELLNRLANDEQALDQFLDAPIATLEQLTGEPVELETLRAVSAGLQERAQDKGATQLSDEALDEVIGALTFSDQLWNQTARATIRGPVGDVITWTR